MRQPGEQPAEQTAEEVQAARDLAVAKLQRRAFDPAKLPRPETSAYRFVLPPGELAIEIGCGVGAHPLAYAAENPEQNLIAIEHTSEKFAKFCRLLAQKQSVSGQTLANLYPVHANAISWVSHMVPLARVAHYLMLYPNPYPKAKDRNKRFYAMPFMRYVIATMTPGGHLTLATNEAFYADEAAYFLTKAHGLELVQRELWSAAEGRRGRSHFEEKYLARGQRCHNLVFRKP